MKYSWHAWGIRYIRECTHLQTCPWGTLALTLQCSRSVWDHSVQFGKNGLQVSNVWPQSKTDQRRVLYLLADIRDHLNNVRKRYESQDSDVLLERLETLESLKDLDQMLSEDPEKFELMVRIGSLPLCFILFNIFRDISTKTIYHGSDKSLNCNARVMILYFMSIQLRLIPGCIFLCVIFTWDTQDRN